MKCRTPPRTIRKGCSCAQPAAFSQSCITTIQEVTHMKKLVALMAAATLAVCLAGCSSASSGGGATSTSAAPQAASSSQGAVAAGGNDEPSPAATASGSPEEIIAQIQQDFANTEQSLLDQQTSLANQIGDSFDGCVANEAAVQAWYDLAVSETEAHGARTIENARQHYRSVVDNIDHGETGLSTMRSTTSTI